MASFYIFGDISTIAGQILMVWKAKLVFGLLKWYNLTRYQPQFTKPKLTDQLYQTKSTESNFSYWIKPNLFNQLYQIKSTKPNLQNQIYLAKCLKFREPNSPTQIFFNQTYKTKSTHPILPNQIYRKLTWPVLTDHSDLTWPVLTKPNIPNQIYLMGRNWICNKLK